MRKVVNFTGFCFLIGVLGVFFTCSVHAADKMILAVVDFSIMNVEMESSQAITEAFRRALAKGGHLQVLSRDKVETAFEEIDPLLKFKLEQIDCTNVACAVRVGRKLKSDRTILGTINKKEDRFILMAKLFNLDKRDVEFIASQVATNEKELVAVAGKLGEKVASWLPRPGETVEQVKQRRIAQQQKEEAVRGKELKDKRAKLAKRKAGTCPEGMILIPATEFVTHSSKKVQVAEYCIDKYEFPNKKGKRPRVKMEWFGAKEECEKQGKRLCTEPEWQTACAGTQKTKYPYGQEYAANKCNTIDSDKGGRLLPSGKCSDCVSSYGVYDMSGNANEWTVDWYDPSIRTVVTKGGSFASKVKYNSCNSAQAAIPFTHRKDSGFRCCK